jgi:Rps23 Pro-64 3,4-dihydroxylase Tpa1-like proline 4-hydroxylase
MTEAIFLKPPPHGTVSNWLGPGMARRLLDFAQARRDSFSPSVVDYKEATEVDLSVRRSVKVRDLGGLKQELRARIRAVLPAMFEELGADAFEPRKFEVEMVAHGDGAFFTEHRDTFLENEKVGEKFVGHRAISAVYYFHRLPKSFSGGVLRIYSLVGREKSTAFVDIEPTNDTLVFFPSWFPHEVLPVVCPSRQFEDSRFAINCWVRR